MSGKGQSRAFHLLCGSLLIARRSLLLRFVLLVFLQLMGFSLGYAANLKIVEAERLELRNENGEELVVLTGSPVKMERDGESIEALRVIYNRTQKRILLSGGVRLKDKNGQLIQADSLELDTSDNSFEAIEVKIESGDFYLSGPICQRAAGQILLQQGYLTPCQRCGQNLPDYAFQASEVLLYPGDRIIARNVWVLFKEQRAIYLPVLLLYLNDRKPRVEFGQSATDGFVLRADLPYVTEFGLGFTLLRYFENRGWGIGFDQFGTGVARERYQFLYLPPPVGASTLPDSDPRKDGLWFYNLSYKLDEPDWRYEALVQRNDGITATDEPGFTIAGSPDVTTFKLEVASQNKPGLEPLYRLTIDSFYDHNEAVPTQRFGVQKLPEVEVSFPRGLQGEFSLTGRAVAGFYDAPSNQLNRSARTNAFSRNARLLLEHNESYRPATPPWPGLSFSLQNRFVGQYYNSQNPDGEYERLIVWNTSIGLQQTLGPVSFSVAANRAIVEGETPFQFDFQRPSRRTTLDTVFAYAPDPAFTLTARVSRDLEKGQWDPAATLEATLQPFPWFSLTTSVGRDLELGRWSIWRSSTTINPSPLGFNLSYEHNIEIGLGRRASGSLSYSPLPFSFRAATGYQWSDVQDKETRDFSQIKQINLYDDLQLSASYAPPGSNIALSETRDLNNGQAKVTDLNFTVRDGLDSYSGQIAFDHLYFGDALRGITGKSSFGNNLRLRLQAILGPNTLELNDGNVGSPARVYIPDFEAEPSEDAFEGTARLGLSYIYASNTTLTLQGSWNFLEGYWIQPYLNFSTRYNEPEGVFTLNARYRLPERNNPLDYLEQLNFSGEVGLLPSPVRTTDVPGLGLQGTLGLTRQTDGRFKLALSEFGPTFSFLGEENTRLYLRILWTSDIDFFLPNLEGRILRPKFVVTVDRCCWAFRASADTLKNEFKFSFLLGGSAADFLFNKDGILFPGADQPFKP